MVPNESREMRNAVFGRTRYSILTSKSDFWAHEWPVCKLKFFGEKNARAGFPTFREASPPFNRRRQSVPGREDGRMNSIGGETSLRAYLPPRPRKLLRGPNGATNFVAGFLDEPDGAVGSGSNPHGCSAVRRHRELIEGLTVGRDAPDLVAASFCKPQRAIWSRGDAEG